MMKLAWLIKRYEDSNWEIVFTEPSSRDSYYHETKPIVYAEVEEGGP